MPAWTMLDDEVQQGMIHRVNREDEHGRFVTYDSRSNHDADWLILHCFAASGENIKYLEYSRKATSSNQR